MSVTVNIVKMSFSHDRIESPSAVLDLMWGCHEDDVILTGE